MSQRAAFQVQILEKLGAPLMTAVSEVSSRQKKDSGEARKQEAERLAELLAKTVQVGVSLAGSMDLKESGGQDDSIRLALAALAGPLIAGQYRMTGKVPGDADIKRLVKALEAVLAFSDNFAPAAENTARLENMAPEAVAADENQIHIRYVNALVPVVNAVAAFPFGRPEAKLLQEVADRLVKKAGDIRKNLMKDIPEQQARQAELSILAALAALYVECHQEEKNKLMAMDEQTRAKTAEAAGGVLPVDPVWAAFETRAGMVELIGKNAAPGGAASGAASPVSPPVQRQAAAPPAQKAPPPSPPPAQIPEKQDGGGEQGGAYSPMGFFKPGGKKPPDKDEGEKGG